MATNGTTPTGNATAPTLSPSNATTPSNATMVPSPSAAAAAEKGFDPTILILPAVILGFIVIIIIYCLVWGPCKKSKRRKNKEFATPVRPGQFFWPRVREDKDDDPYKQKNYLFYTGKIQSRPQGDFIDRIHKHWLYDYALLEIHHGYIQWLFPVFESGGMSATSEELGKEEAKLLRNDMGAAVGIIKSYKLMLAFYGCVLLDVGTGKIGRHPHTWKFRYRNLARHPHNNLRISRILISLGELGFVRYKKPFAEHWRTEILENDQLKHCKSSLMNFWLPLLNHESRGYKSKTFESPEDREESVFFKHMDDNSPEYQAVIGEIEAYASPDDEPSVLARERGEVEDESGSRVDSDEETSSASSSSSEVPATSLSSPVFEEAPRHRRRRRERKDDKGEENGAELEEVKVDEGEPTQEEVVQEEVQVKPRSRRNKRTDDDEDVGVGSAQMERSGMKRRKDVFDGIGEEIKPEQKGRRRKEAGKGRDRRGIEEGDLEENL